MSEHIGDLLSVYIDGELTEKEKAAVEEHLAICPECKQQLDELISIREQIISAFEMTEIPDRIEDVVMAKIRQSSIQKYFGAALSVMIGFGLLFLLLTGPLLTAGLHIFQTAFSISRGLTYAFPSIIGSIPNMVAVVSIVMIIFIVLALVMLRYIVHAMGKTLRAGDM